MRSGSAPNRCQADSGGSRRLRPKLVCRRVLGRAAGHGFEHLRGAGCFIRTGPYSCDPSIARRAQDDKSVEKRRGDFPCGISPLIFRFLEGLVRLPNHNSMSFRNRPRPANLAARAPRTLPSSHFAARAFPVPSVSIRFPERLASPVAGSLDGPCPLSSSGRSLFR